MSVVDTGNSKKRGYSSVEGTADAKRQKVNFSIGDSGIFFTTGSPGACSNGRKELMRLLKAVVDEPDGGDSMGSGTSASAQIDAELAELRAGWKRFIPCAEVAKGTGFVKCADANDVPSDLVLRMFKAQCKEIDKGYGMSVSRSLCRVLPIDHTCKPYVEDFRKLAEEVLRPVFAKPVVWALEFKARNTSTLKKDMVLEVLDKIVADCGVVHKVNINDPDKCILVEVNPLFCGVSVVECWGPMKKYNLHQLANPEKKPCPAQTPSKAAAPPPIAGSAAASSSSGGEAVSTNLAPEPVDSATAGEVGQSQEAGEAQTKRSCTIL